MGIISNGNTVIDNGAIDANEVDTTQLATDAVETAKIADAQITLAKLSATGTKDATTFLRGDNTFATAGGGTETGSVIIMPVNTVPTGYLECDGSAISRTTYADLFTVISTTYGSGDGSTTFNIPDLRGEFIRGWDNGRGQDSGRSIGTSQSDAFQGHHHSYRYYNQFLAGGGSKTDDMPQSPNSTSNNRVTTPISDGSNGTPRTANETRPKNIAMMYCIKY